MGAQVFDAAVAMDGAMSSGSAGAEGWVGVSSPHPAREKARVRMR
jgi:hypothetical protein